MATTSTHRSVSTGWFTSTRSNNGNQCVEVRFDGTAVLVRDSKYRRDPANRPADEPVITVTALDWTAFLDALRAGRRTEGSLVADTAADGHTTLRHGDTVLTYTPAEWDAFLLGAHDGEFDRVASTV
ncbi:DUF397 domain-containing protein [Nocardia brasiliensis]|uniref:DUF397 domain-containing protein n=1 Tax=Nocardia brasiliensis TaxID=37326 RepID=A0A6G9Y1S3_NOCBR|nr:DUF397 domain-containing protein [Nocardia brasiliensis]QIS07036.1 DUF397 domain-containing protein [Nocardia brasiliensis]